MTDLIRNAIINTLFTYPITAAFAYAHGKMVSVPHRWFYTFGYSAILTAARCGLIAAGETARLVYLLNPIVLGGMLLFSNDKWAYRAFASGLEYLNMYLVEVLGEAMLTLSGIHMLSGGVVNLAQRPGAYLLVRTVLMILTVLLLYLLVLMWNRVFRKNSQKDLLYFALFPFSQGLIGLVAITMATKAGGAQNDYLVLSLLLAVSLAADVVMLWALQRLRQADVSRQRAAFLQRQLDQQRTYYERIARDAAETARVRHDIRNQLLTARALFRNGETASAEGMLNELSDRIDQPQRYCGSAVVNAVMNEKAGACRDAGIRLECDLALDEQTGIAEMDLCSLFSNVMDNAVSGCCQSGAEQKRISLRASVNRGYLILRCENTAKPAKRSPAAALSQEHGWGLTILGELTKRYEGSLNIREQPDEFTIEASLKCAGDPQTAKTARSQNPRTPEPI